MRADESNQLKKNDPKIRNSHELANAKMRGISSKCFVESVVFIT